MSLGALSLWIAANQTAIRLLRAGVSR